MGGGTLLLLFLISFLPLNLTMIYQGFIQLFSNLFRALINCKYINLKILSFYFIGLIFAYIFLNTIPVAPKKSWVLILLGIVTLFSPYSKFIKLNLQNNFQATVCGFLICLINTFSGASAGLLNSFFFKSDLSKFEIIATKSLAQAFTHTIKVFFYFKLLKHTDVKSFFFEHQQLLVFAGITFLGAFIGKKLLNKLPDENFRKYGNKIVVLLGIIALIKGIFILADQ